MLHLEIEVQTIQFFIDKPSDTFQIVVNESNVSKILTSKLQSKCKDVQAIREFIEFNIQYTENKYIKIMIQDNKYCYGEAIVDLGFYIENNLPLVIDKISINNRYDQEACIQVSLAWNQIKKDQIDKHFNKKEKLNTNSKIEDYNTRNRECQHSPIYDQSDQSYHQREETLKKFSDPQVAIQNLRTNCNQKNKNELENIIQNKIQSRKNPKINIDTFKSKEEKDLETPQISRENKFVFPTKIQQKCQKNNEGQFIQNKYSDEMFRDPTRPKAIPKKPDNNIENLNSRPTQNEQALLLSCRQLESSESENSVYAQNQILRAQNKQLKLQIEKLQDQLKKSEAAFQLLSETYVTLQNDFKKIQITSFQSNMSASSFLNELQIQEKPNKEVLQLKREIEIKNKEIEQLKQDNTKLENKQSQLDLQYNTQLTNFSKEIKYKNQQILELKAEINLQLQNQSNLSLSRNQNQALTEQISKLQNKEKCEEAKNYEKLNQELILNSKKDQVRLEGVTKELEISKRIVELSDQRCNSLEKQIHQLEKAVLNGKQSVADILNAVMECGGQLLYDQIERCLAYRRSLKLD